MLGRQKLYSRAWARMLHRKCCVGVSNRGIASARLLHISTLLLTTTAEALCSGLSSGRSITSD